jgi:hypothetical protein
VSGADAVAPFYRVGGGAGRPGVGEEWVAVVCHNGDEGGCFGRGSVGVVLGSDEGWGVLWPLRERKRHREAARSHERQRQHQLAQGGRRTGGARMSTGHGEGEGGLR